MSAEFFICFKDAPWYIQRKSILSNFISQLPSFSGKVGLHELHLGSSKTSSGYIHDIRIFLEGTGIMIDAISNSNDAYSDVRHFIRWLRSQADISVYDDDGEVIDFFD